MPSVSNMVLDAIVARHRLSVDGPIVPLESAGLVHALWRLGTKLLLRVPGDFPAEAFFDEVVAAGLLHVDAVAWFREVCNRLDVVIVEAGPPPQVLIHNDIKPDNVMMLRRTPLAGPSWYRPIAATLTDLLTFAIDEPSIWNQWTNKLT
jgi:hypothetical protein